MERDLQLAISYFLGPFLAFAIFLVNSNIQTPLMESKSGCVAIKSEISVPQGICDLLQGVEEKNSWRKILIMANSQL